MTNRPPRRRSRTRSGEKRWTCNRPSVRWSQRTRRDLRVPHSPAERRSGRMNHEPPRSACHPIPSPARRAPSAGRKSWSRCSKDPSRWPGDRRRRRCWHALPAKDTAPRPLSQLSASHPPPRGLGTPESARDALQVPRRRRNRQRRRHEPDPEWFAEDAGPVHTHLPIRPMPLMHPKMDRSGRRQLAHEKRKAPAAGTP